MFYWPLVLKLELGVFHFLLFLFGSTIGGLFVWLAEVRLTQPKVRDTPTRGGRFDSRWVWLRLTLYILCCALLALNFTSRGETVGGLVMLDEHGYPQRATLQMIVTVGGKVKMDHVVLRAVGADGSTQALRRTGYGSGRKPLQPSATFWDEEVLRSMETLEILATADEFRQASPELRTMESRVKRIADDGSVVFLRRDGLEVRVDPVDVVGNVDVIAVGCAIDTSRRGSVRDSNLINARGVPWPRSGAGCPSQPPTDVALLVSDDAAFGDVRPLLTLQDSAGKRWQASLAGISGTEDPRLVGAVPLPGALVVVATDGDDLIFVRLSWGDGAVLDAVHW